MSESVGYKCSECKGLLDVKGVFHKHIEQPFMPPKTNFDKITESVESLAKMIVQMSLNGDFVPCFYAPDGTEFVMDKERAIQHTIEWLQKEI